MRPVEISKTTKPYDVDLIWKVELFLTRSVSGTLVGGGGGGRIASVETGTEGLGTSTASGAGSRFFCKVWSGTSSETTSEAVGE